MIFKGTLSCYILLLKYLSSHRLWYNLILLQTFWFCHTFWFCPVEGGFKSEKAVKNCGRQYRSFFYAFISIPFLKVNRISSRLYTVAYSTRLYQSSSLNSVSGPSLFSSSARNLSVFSRFAIRSVMAEPTASSRSFIRSKRSASRHIFSGTPSG